MDGRETLAQTDREVGSTGAPRSLALAGNIRTGRDFANLMAALMHDAISGALTPNAVNSACHAGKLMLRTVELALQHGVQPERIDTRAMVLTDGGERPR